MKEMQEEKKSSNNISNLVPQRLREARSATGKRVKDVAALVGVTAQVLSMYELGRCNPSIEVFNKLKDIYGLPMTYFLKPVAPSSNRGQTFFRSFATVTKGKREIAFIKSNWFTREIYRQMLESISFPKVDPLFLKMKMSTTLDAKGEKNFETLSKIVRREWNLGHGPIENLTSLLESKGIIVVRMDIDDTIDGFSYWEDDRPFIFVNSRNNAFRLRMSIAHELCHLLFHEGEDAESDLKKIEKEAKSFASSFLLPETSFPNDVMSTSLEQLLYLKPKWMVSVQAMIMRCEQLSLISDERALYLHKQISRRRWRSVEPGDSDVSPEKPALLRQAINLLIDKSVYTKGQLKGKLALDADFIEESCSLVKGFLSEDNIIYVDFRKDK